MPESLYIKLVNECVGMLAHAAEWSLHRRPEDRKYFNAQLQQVKNRVIEILHEWEKAPLEAPDGPFAPQ